MYNAGTPNSTSVWSSPITKRTNAAIRFPMAYDKKIHQFFHLQYGDGQGYDAPTIHSLRVDIAAGVQTNITFKPSAAFEQFKTDAPVYAAMDYDPENDRFLFYDGRGTSVGRVCVIKPSSTSDEWEMSLMQTTANSVKPPPSMNAGLNSNFKYIPA